MGILIKVVLRGQFMVKDWQVRKRRPVRRKQVAPLLAALEDSLGVDLSLEGAFLEIAEYGPWRLMIVDKEPHAVEVENSEGERVALLTLRGLLSNPPQRGWLEVDRGATPFLLNGADCMAAGIHEAHENISKGDLVWIRDQEHKRPLALGWACMDAEEMTTNNKGKAVNALHWVGDELWNMEF